MRTQKVVYGATTLALAWPVRPWTPGTVAVGAGREESAAGVPSAWVTRRDRTLLVTLRFPEEAWPDVRAWIEYAQGGGTFSWYPDAALTTHHTCYLIAPAVDEHVRPTRAEDPGEMELVVEIRRTDGAAMDEEYFA